MAATLGMTIQPEPGYSNTVRSGGAAAAMPVGKPSIIEVTFREYKSGGNCKYAVPVVKKEDMVAFMTGVLWPEARGILAAKGGDPADSESEESDEDGY